MQMTIVEEWLLQGKAEGKVEGKVEALREVLLDFGTKQFGEPDAGTLQNLQAVTDPERLKRMVKMLLEVHSWHELSAVT